MLLWYVGMSVLLVANVFRSVGVDYRLVALGSLLPLLVDLPTGSRGFGHTLLFPVGLLVLVMLSTMGRSRLARRRWLCLPIGVFCGLILSGGFTQPAAFWWPLGRGGFAHDGLLPVWWAVVAEELLGAVACWWVVGQFDLWLAGPWERFRRTGRLEERP